MESPNQIITRCKSKLRPQPSSFLLASIVLLTFLSLPINIVHGNESGSEDKKEDKPDPALKCIGGGAYGLEYQ